MSTDRLPSGITVRKGIQWYISRPLDGSVSGITRIECKIGAPASELRLTKLCNGCQHDVVFHTANGTHTEKSLSPGCVFAIKEELKATWDGPMVVHFRELDLADALGGRASSKKEVADAKRIIKTVAEKVSLSKSKAKPKKISDAPRKTILKK